MARLILALLGAAALQLGTPDAARAAELRPAGEPTRMAPRLDTRSERALTRDRSRIDTLQLVDVTPGSPTEPPQLPRASAHEGSPPDAAPRAAPAPLPRVLPDARAPPA